MNDSCVIRIDCTRKAVSIEFDDVVAAPYLGGLPETQRSYYIGLILLERIKQLMAMQTPDLVQLLAKAHTESTQAS